MNAISFFSIFTRQRLVTLATPEGRISLTDMLLSITNRAEKHESVVYSKDQYKEILNQKFGIRIKSSFEAAPESGIGE